MFQARLKEKRSPPQTCDLNISKEANRDPSWVVDTEVKKAILPEMVREMCHAYRSRHKS